MKLTADFHELYIRYAGDIYRFSLFLCGNTEDAEDITSETFVRALTGKAPLASSTLKGYLLTIARNLYLEGLRQKKEVQEISSDIIDSGASPDKIAILKDELEGLQFFLQTLPEIDRTALLLRSDGLSYSEISSTLNISIASAKVKVHRVRLKLVEWRLNR